jgi:hypothetical protein
MEEPWIPVAIYLCHDFIGEDTEDHKEQELYQSSLSSPFWLTSRWCFSLSAKVRNNHNDMYLKLALTLDQGQTQQGDWTLIT